MTTIITKPPKWRITLTSGGRAGRIECDGEPVKNVVGVTVTAESGKPPRVTLTMLASSVDIEIDETTQGKITPAAEVGL